MSPLEILQCTSQSLGTDTVDEINAHVIYADPVAQVDGLLNFTSLDELAQATSKYHHRMTERRCSPD